jgi:HSP20 family molecular chaperone IbpA
MANPLLPRFWGSSGKSHEDKIDAVFRNGVLKITLPKAPEAQTRSKKIAIKAHH